jgi:Xaa-Pro aminopeptidase
MRTVQPSIMIGSYTWDQDRLPRDEFQFRMAALHRIMDAKGLKAVFVYGDAAEHSALAWFTNFIPRLRWGMALLPRAGEPRLLISMSSRDVPAMKLMTWIPDVASGWTWESAFDPWLVRLNADHPTDIGTVGFGQMQQLLFRSLGKSLGNRFRLHVADADVAAVRSLRPRERSQLREASGVVRAAADAFVKAWRAGMDVEAAALEGERTARLMAAQDVRTLVSFDGGRTLGPFRGSFEAKSDSLVGYLASKHRGYWADTFVTATAGASAVQQRVRAALDAVLRSAAPGVAAALLHAQAVEQLGPLPLHPVLSNSIGHRIGLSLNEGGELTPDSRHALKLGEVYALHVGAYDPASGGALTSAMIALTETGADVFHRSPGASVPLAASPNASPS